jgi:catechol 2,3-dioxygenase-like lactoylglutathione lyase family enzyme
MSLKSIRCADHVGLTVPDLDEAVSFFVDVLGATEQFRFARKDDPELMEHGVGVHPRASFRAAMLRLTPALSVELFQWQAPAQNARMPEPSDSGGHHLCVIVDDLDVAVDELRRRPDLRVYGSPGRLTVGPHAGGRWIYFRTSWGLQIELIALPPARGREGGMEEHRDVQ